MKKTRLVILLGAILPLAGCFDGNGNDDDRETFQGLYEGTLTIDGSDETLLYLAYGGRAVGISESAGALYEGAYAIDNDEFAGEHAVYQINGPKAGVTAFEGTFTGDDSLEGTFEPLEGELGSGTFALERHPEANRDLTLDEIADTYYAPNDDDLQVVIDVDGGLHGSDGLGCMLEGQVAIPESDLNMLEVELTTRSDCQAIPGDADASYEGWATVLDGTLLLGVASDNTALVYRLTDVPEWILELPERYWAKVNTNTKAEAIAAFDEVTNGCGRTATDLQIGRIWEAFAGSAWDTRRKVAWIFGGGHAVTRFNAPIAIDVFEREWQILHTETDTHTYFFDGYPLHVTADYAHDYQGAPVSAHAYDNNKYLPVLDRFITFGGAQEGDGSWWRKFLDQDGNEVVEEARSDADRTGPYLYDYEKRDPTQVGGHDGTAVNPSGCNNADITGAQAWTNLDFMEDLPNWSSPDRSTVCRVEEGLDVCYHARTTLQRIEFDGDEVSLEPASHSWQGHIAEHSAIIVPHGDKELYLQVRLRPHTGFFELKWWEIQDLPGTVYTSEVVGGADGSTVDYADSSYGTHGPLPDEGEPNRSATPGTIYDSERDKIIVWRGGQNLYRLIPPDTLSSHGWRVVDFENNPVSDQAPDASGFPSGFGAHRGVVGHFHYDPDWDLYFGIEGVHGNLWVYKPPNWNP